MESKKSKDIGKSIDTNHKDISDIYKNEYETASKSENTITMDSNNLKDKSTNSKDQSTDNVQSGNLNSDDKHSSNILNNASKINNNISQASIIDKVFHENEQLNNAISKNLSSRSSVSQKFIQQAQTAFKTFNPSKVSEDIRKDPTYFASGDNLLNSQKAIITRNIETFKNSDIKHSLQLILSNEDIQKYGLTKHGDG